MEKTINIGGRLHNPAVGGSVAGADEIKDDTKGKMQNVINQETDAELVRLDEAKQEKLTFDQIPTEGSTNPVTSGGVHAADAALQQAIEAILLLIPSAASALNQLADKSFVNSSISTATATFRGTYNLVTDLDLTVSATHQQIATALASVVSTADNNDYCFVQIPVSDQSSEIRVTERYKFDGTSWSYEYDLNNSGFTADQWAAINSGITSVLVGKLGALPTAAELAIMFNGKQNTLTFDTTPTSGSNNPVTSGGLYAKFATIDAMIPTGADANNKLVAESRLVAYVTTLINALDATFDVTSADGHVTLRMTQVDGMITSVQIFTSDIASDAALTLLGGRVSTAEADIDALQDAYAALTQSDVVIVEGALPSSGQQQNIIYRQLDQEHTPPQFYSDYMWNGTTWVLMATYMNAIDPRPKKGSQNLVTSGGVFDNMGALDVSELNATENPHTLATYADLSAALVAIPSDYQKGGMSIKFVCSSDNKYYQFRLMAQSFTIDTTKWAVYSNGVYIYNPEFIAVWAGKDDKILVAIENDGNVLFGAGVPRQIVEYVENKIAELNGNIDAIQAFLNGFTDTTLLEYLDSTYGKYIENPEFAGVITDKDGEILLAFKNDGDVFFGFGCPTQIQDFIANYINKDGNSIRKYLDETFGYYVEDPEGRVEIKTDNEERIISYRDADGRIHENVGIETNSLQLTENGMSEFQQALKDSGFQPGGAGDFSDTITKKGKNPVYIPEPKCASLNILWDGDLTQLSKSDRPDGIQKVNYDVKCQVEFFDGQGIYFKKTALIGAQGNSSMNFAKKNISLKIFDTDDVEGSKHKWGKGDTFGIVFGDWVMQKSWHLKAYCTNIFKCEPVVGYRIANKIWESRGILNDRPWKTALLGGYTFTDNSDTSASVNDMSLQMDNGARCMPDGYPVIVYQNGVFYGIFEWQIKKDSDNYHMDTDEPLHIHLDGELNNSTLWRGTIDWTKFEIRCPEGLKDMNGDDYDGDHPQEISASDTKTAIINLSNRYSEITGAATDEEKLALFNTYFDRQNIIDYVIFSQITGNYDGFNKNWQWITYDGIKWFICPYDLDGLFGCNALGTFTEPADISHDTDYRLMKYLNWYVFTDIVKTTYLPEMKARYAELRGDLGITSDFIINLINSYTKTVGEINYKKEYTKWTNAECNRDNILNDGWEMIEDEYWGTSPAYNPSTIYQTGDECWYGNRKFRATKNFEASGVVPYIQLGCHDNIYRINAWLTERLSLLDSYYNVTV